MTCKETYINHRRRGGRRDEKEKQSNDVSVINPGKRKCIDIKTKNKILVLIFTNFVIFICAAAS